MKHAPGWGVNQIGDTGRAVWVLIPGFVLVGITVPFAELHSIEDFQVKATASITPFTWTLDNASVLGRFVKGLVCEVGSSLHTLSDDTIRAIEERLATKAANSPLDRETSNSSSIVLFERLSFLPHGFDYDVNTCSFIHPHNYEPMIDTSIAGTGTLAINLGKYHGQRILLFSTLAKDQHIQFALTLQNGSWCPFPENEH